jgi:hypothetical protein
MKIGIYQHVYRIWDQKEKAWVDDINGDRLCFPTLEVAESYKSKLLENGNYPDEPHTVFEVCAIKIENTN